MVTSTQITPGITIKVGSQLYQVESSVRVTVTKGNPFIKTKLRNLVTNKITEKNFQIGEKIEEISPEEVDLEYLYMEGKEYLFLEFKTLEQIPISASVIGERAEFLKEGVQLKGLAYGGVVFSIELPQFLELMIAQTDGDGEDGMPAANVNKTAVLETGAKLTVPPFIEIGDIVKVDTKTGEFVQRV